MSKYKSYSRRWKISLVMLEASASNYSTKEKKFLHHLTSSSLFQCEMFVDAEWINVFDSVCERARVNICVEVEKKKYRVKVFLRTLPVSPTK